MVEARSVDERGTSAALHRVSIVADGDDYILGRPDLGRYVAVPEPGAVLVRVLQGGASLPEAVEHASVAAGEEVDGDDFLTGLAEAGLLDDPADSQPVRAVAGVPPRVAQPLFGRAAWTVYAVATVAVVGLFLIRPDLLPRFEDVWFLPNPLLSVLLLLPVGLLFSAAHEFWHYLAARALGIPAWFRVSRRGIFLIFETDLTQLVTVPRRRRYSPMLAGMALDVVLLLGFMLTRLAFREEILAIPPTLDRLCGALILGKVVGLVWQVAGVAIRSDMYAVLANALGCHNLYRATWLTARRRLWGLTRDQRTELAGIGDRDLSVAHWFFLVYLAGMVAMAWILFDVIIPITLGMIYFVAPHLASFGFGTDVVWLSFGFATILVLRWGMTPVLAVREYRMRKKGKIA